MTTTYGTFLTEEEEKDPNLDYEALVRKYTKRKNNNNNEKLK